MLADEPTGNLDPTNAKLSLELIQSLCSENGAALILVSHDPGLNDTFERTLELSELNQAGIAGIEERNHEVIRDSFPGYLPAPRIEFDNHWSGRLGL